MNSFRPAASRRRRRSSDRRRSGLRRTCSNGAARCAIWVLRAMPIDDIRFKAAISEGCDMFVTLGGASVGDHDLIQKALVPDLKVAFWKIAMRPGKPLIHRALQIDSVLGAARQSRVGVGVRVALFEADDIPFARQQRRAVAHDAGAAFDGHCPPTTSGRTISVAICRCRPTAARSPNRSRFRTPACCAPLRRPTG